MTPIIVNTEPGEKFQLAHRLWQGCPTILRTRGGRLFAGWYSGGSGEAEPENYNLLIRSDDEGWTWTPPVAVVESDISKQYIAIASRFILPTVFCVPNPPFFPTAIGCCAPTTGAMTATSTAAAKIREKHGSPAVPVKN